jgi:hypothetical protein
MRLPGYSSARRFRTISLVFLALVITTLTSCGFASSPSITASPTGAYRTGEVVWRELVTPNPKQAAAFYSGLFGWEISQAASMSTEYWMIRHQGIPIGGIVPMPATTRNASGEWICSVSVPDVDATTQKALNNGAVSLFTPTDFKGRGRTALFRDPQGAPIALIHAEGGDPARQAAAENSWLWTELWSQNMAGSIQFYTSTFGGSIERKKDESREYVLLRNESREVAGIVASPVENVRSHWVSYVRVADPAATIRKARELGARILLEPRPEVRNGSLGVFLDPTGAPVAVQRYPVK